MRLKIDAWLGTDTVLVQMLFYCLWDFGIVYVCEVTMLKILYFSECSTLHIAVFIFAE